MADITHIPLDKLVPSEDNVRRTAATAAGTLCKYKSIMLCKRKWLMRYDIKAF